MKPRFLTALAMSAALTAATVTPSFAEAPFRSAAPQSFSAEELHAYGLNEQATERAIALQDQGYEIRVLSEEEAAGYQAGITDTQWLLLGILAGVIVIAVVVAD